MSLIKDISERKNLLSAWLKVKYHLLKYEGWVDLENLYTFEAVLDDKLRYIHEQFSQKEWKLNKMVPLPRLKIQRNNDKSTNEKIRQDFWVPLIDQIAWVAVVNIVGPILDLQMPGWSFANRLYRSVLYEDTEIQGEEKGKVGPYRHYSGQVYRSWHVGWSLYRRLSYLTWLNMVNSSDLSKKIDTLSDGDKRVYKNNAEHPVFDDYSWKIQYLERNYWNIKLDSEIFYAKVDFKDFFPLLKREAVLEGLIYGLKNSQNYVCTPDEISDLTVLLKQMLEFSWVDPIWDDDEIKCAFLDHKNDGIPVGLLVSGFLANAALLPIDAELQNELLNNKSTQIAHFRYVDDHLILAPQFSSLIRWIQNYRKMVKKIGAEFNIEKIEPEELKASLEGIQPRSEKMRAREKCTIDSQNPKQFITQTLTLISDVAQKDFGLLHFNEQTSLLEELRHLLKTDLQKDEVKNDTRMTFAINRIIRLIVDWQRDWTVLVGMREAQAQEDEHGEYIDDGSLQNLEVLEKVENEEYLRIIRSSFSSLIETILMFPDKLRLWRLIVDFCRKTGYEGWQDLGTIFAKQKTKHQRQYRFIKTLIWQELSKQTLLAAKELKDPVHLYSWEIEAQTRFLQSIENWKETLHIGIRPEEYEKISWEYLDNSIKLIKFIKDNEIPNFPTEKPELYYWAEMLLTSPNSTEPTKLWTGNISKLDQRNSITRTLMLMYPKEVAQYLPEQFKKITASFHRKRSAWEWEGNSFQKDLKGEINLVTWCKWTNERQNDCNKNNTYDPRIGEWTVLEIIRQILDKYKLEVIDITKLKRFVKKEWALIHPANFSISEKWIGTYEEKLTWEYWKSFVRDTKNSVKVINRGLIKYDIRISPVWLIDKEMNQQTDRLNSLLYESGLLLLGLLRKSFSWPSRWNLPAYSRDWRTVSREWFGLCACSSSTLSILEALLLPRHAESRDIKEHPKLSYKFEDDTIYDPVAICNTQEINERIVNAQKELEKNQISSFMSNPRQLIPINIYDLIKRKWLRKDE